MGRLKETLQMCIKNDWQCEGGIFQSTGVQKHVLSRFRRNLCSLKLETIEKLLDYFEIDLIIPERLKKQQDARSKSKYTKTQAWYAEQERRRRIREL